MNFKKILEKTGIIEVVRLYNKEKRECKEYTLALKEVKIELKNAGCNAVKENVEVIDGYVCAFEKAFHTELSDEEKTLLKVILSGYAMDCANNSFIFDEAYKNFSVVNAE